MLVHCIFYDLKCWYIVFLSLYYNTPEQHDNNTTPTSITYFFVLFAFLYIVFRVICVVVSRSLLFHHLTTS